MPVRDPLRRLGDRLIAAVRAAYGIPVATFTSLPLGLDSAAWTYRARTADGASYFVKVRTGLPNPAGLLVPRFLHDHGVSSVVAPFPTRTGTLWVEVDDYVLILYPFIEGATGGNAGMTERHWVTLGVILRQMHAATLPSDLSRRLHRETFTPAWSAVARQVDVHLMTRPLTDPSEQELAVFWRARRPEIQALLERAAILGRRLRAAAPPLVLCHTDVHPWNILIDRAGRLWVVDWDEVALAPKECDLMFVVGGLGGYLAGPREEAWFFAGYGAAAVDPLALAYYRYARAVGDIGGFGEQAALLPDVDAATKQAAVQWLKGLFAPGNIVALAYAADVDGSK